MGNPIPLAQSAAAIVVAPCLLLIVGGGLLLFLLLLISYLEGNIKGIICYNWGGWLLLHDFFTCNLWFY